MWARVVEVMIGCWLAMSPFIFGHAADATALWITDFGAAAVVITLALISYLPRFEHAHLAILLAAGYLIAFGAFFGPPTEKGLPPPAYQNDLLVGLLLLMFSLIPNEATRPPKVWREAA